MSYRVEVTSGFKKQAKRLLRKFPSIRIELLQLVNSLENEPKQGKPLGNNCYKIRMVVASKGKGKSGGARIITHVYFAKSTVYLLTIYDKSDLSTLSDSEIKDLLSGI
jgi:mRNA-degrading endonuclease RelE of RelBE toxin-antitoxin system